MNREREKLKSLKDEYMEMKIPKELDEAIIKGVEAGRRQSRRTQNWQQWMVGAAAAMMVFVSGLNLSPSFAATMEEVPFLGRLVQSLIFVDHQASGGQVTDGLNVNEIQSGQNAWMIRFGEAELTGAYGVKYSENPSVLTFQLSGVRMLEAQKDFQTMMESELIEAVYPLMTLDDSTVRFQIVFSQPVLYQLEEYQEPAGLKISVQALEHEPKQVYALRSDSYPVGEAFAQMEERLAVWCAEKGVEGNYRILKDAKGQMLVEFGTYDSEAEAQAVQRDWEQAFGQALWIEARDAFVLPAASLEKGEAEQTQEESALMPRPEAQYGAVLIAEDATREVFLQVGEASLTVWGPDGDLVEELSYETFDFYKQYGEASFILQVEGEEETYVFSGIFSEFMAQLSRVTEVLE